MQFLQSTTKMPHLNHYYVATMLQDTAAQNVKLSTNSFSLTKLSTKIFRHFLKSGQFSEFWGWLSNFLTFQIIATSVRHGGVY